MRLYKSSNSFRFRHKMLYSLKGPTKVPEEPKIISISVISISVIGLFIIIGSVILSCALSDGPSQTTEH